MPDQKKRRLSKAPTSQSKRRKAHVAAPRRTVEADALPWKNMPVPEMFDDAEGFYGLEEVKGVEVVRNGEAVQFMAAVESDESDEFVGFNDPPGQSQADAAAVSDEERGGVPHHASGRTAEPTIPTEMGAKKSKALETKRIPRALRKEDAELEANVFNQLGALGEGEEDIGLSAWVPLGLSTQMLSAVARLGFAKPSPIQEQAIPEVIQGHDVVGKAATGSGKTLAFAIPIVEEWLSGSQRAIQGANTKKHPIALVLSPTRELAHQIAAHIKDLCAGLATGPRICSVTGGLSLQKQQRQLETADVVIGTPGRLWEVLRSSTSFLASFRRISFLVVDEADRLLTEGHFKEAAEIFSALDRTEDDRENRDDDTDRPAAPPRQTLVFSATFNKGLQHKLAGKGRFNLVAEAQSMDYLMEKLNFREAPKFIDVNPVSQMADRLKEGMIECGAMEKDLFLYSVLLLQPTRRALVFTNSISSVRRITPFLQCLNMPALPLHSGMIQKARLRSIERFTAGSSGTPGGLAHRKTPGGILVATDVAARGLDIPGIDLVIHYHVPRTADSYVHRSGRTARANSSGISVLLCSPDEVVPTRRLVAKVHANAGIKAWKAAQAGKKTKDAATAFFVRTVDIDRQLVARLRERVVLAKKITDAAQAKEKGKKDDDWMKAAAEELGVDYDSGDVERAGRWSGRGSGRKKKQKEARELTRAELGALRAELRQLLGKRINTGVSEKYLDGLDVGELLRQGVGGGGFLGKVDGLGLDD